MTEDGEVVESEWKSLLDALPDARILVREDRTVAYANRAFRERYGYSTVEGRRCHELIFHDAQPCDASGRGCPLFEAGLKDSAVCHHKIPGPMGVRYVETELTPVRGADGRVRLFMERVSESRGRGMRTGDEAVAQSRRLAGVLEKIAARASDDAPVVFVGEKGSGKSLFARLLHENGRRAARPFVSLSCLHLTGDDLERELLGDGSNQGLLDTASGGTLFLSDVDRLDPSLYEFVLDLAVQRTYRVRGASQIHFSRLRVVFSCERFDVSRAFPKSFLYALTPYVIGIPPLRERLEDVPFIASRFLSERCAKTLSEEASLTLLSYSWPGNLPELEAVLQTAAFAASGPVVGRGDLEKALKYVTETCGEEVPSETPDLAALAAGWRGSRAELARFVGVSERTLYRKLRAANGRKKES